MFEVEHSIVRQRVATIIADAEHGRMVSRARRVRKRDGRVEHAEAGDHRPPALDC
jgi:hypothetical protein